MVSIIVICVGLLGIAKLQALAVSNTTSSRLRALAAIQAASFASSMHSNRQYWGNTPPASVTVTGTTVTSSDGALQGAAAGANAGTVCMSSPAGPATAGSGPACGAVQLAAFDLVRWANSVAGLLPNPNATILCPPTLGAGPTSCTIQVSWTEQAVAINAQQANATAQCKAQAAAGQQCFEVPTYTLYVEP
jgi:type IV pilus assembly protein PilV